MAEADDVGTGLAQAAIEGQPLDVQGGTCLEAKNHRIVLRQKSRGVSRLSLSHAVSRVVLIRSRGTNNHRGCWLKAR